MVSTRQPLGIAPNAESSNELGKSIAVSASMPTGLSPSIFARTGLKSTNHDWNKVRAICSSVSFMRLFSSIFFVQGAKDMGDSMLLR